MIIAEFLFHGFDGELRDLNGPYGKSGQENHGRPVYAKIGTNQGHKVKMYYWDSRDGEQLHGWWLAPEVGGAHVWAMTPIGTATPPQTGWRVPWHGRVNPKVTCMVHGKRVNSDGSEYSAELQQLPVPQAKRPRAVGDAVATTAASAPAGPQTAMNAAFGQAFQAWQQQAGFAMPWQQKLAGGAIPAFTGNQIAPPSSGVPPEQMPVVHGQAEKNKKEQEELSKNIPVELRRAEFERRTEAQQVRFFEDRLHSLVAQAKQLNDHAKRKMAAIQENPNFKTLLTEKSEGKLNSDDLKTRSEELERVLITIIRQLQTSKLATNNKILEGESVIKESKVPIAIWPEVRTKLQAYVKECEDLLQEATNWKQKKDDKEAVLWTKAADALVVELELVLAKADKEIENLKDAAALLSSDLWEFLNTRELLGASQATESVIGAATKAVQAASQAITEKIPLFKNASPAAFQKFRVLQVKIPTWNEDIQRIQKLSLDADKKGRSIMLAEEQARFEEKEKEKERQFEQWNQNMIDDAWAEVYVVEELLEKAEHDTTKAHVSATREAMVGLEKTVEDFIMKKDASNKTREVLSSSMGSKVRELRCRVTECQKRISAIDFDEEQDKIMVFAGRVMAFLEKNQKTEKELFETLAKGAEVVTAVQVRAWCEVVANAKKEEVTKALERADWPRPTTKQTLTLEEFPLLYRVYFKSCKGATLVSSDDKPVEVPAGTLVMLSGVPDKNMLPVKAVYGERSGLLNAELPGWARVPPYYQCVHETVLTSSFDMGDFQLVKRIKVGEKLRIIEPPRVWGEQSVNPNGMLIRMRAQSLEDGKIGYCTIRKPGGPDYLEADVFSTHGTDANGGTPADPSLEGIHCVEGEAIEALRDGDWVECHLGKISPDMSTRKNSNYVEVIWANETRGRVGRQDIRCAGSKAKIRLSMWSLSDFVGRVVKRAYDEMSKVVIPHFNVHSDSGALLPSEQLREMGQKAEEQAKAATQILDDLHDYLKEKTQDTVLRDRLTESMLDVAKKHNRLMEKLNNFRNTTAQAIQGEITKAVEVEVEIENEERQKMEKNIEDRSEKIIDQGVNLIDILSKLSEDAEDATLSLEDLERLLSQMEEQEKNIEKYLKEEMDSAKATPGAGSSNLVLDLLTLQRKGLSSTSPKIGAAFKTIRKRIETKKESA